MGGDRAHKPHKVKTNNQRKFSTAYGYADKNTKYIVIANTTSETIKLKKNRMVAEFHPRDASAYDVLQCGGEEKEQATHDTSGGLNRAGESRQCGHTIHPCQKTPIVTRTVIVESENTNNSNNTNSKEYSHNMGDDAVMVVSLTEDSCQAGRPQGGCTKAPSEAVFRTGAILNSIQGGQPLIIKGGGGSDIYREERHHVGFGSVGSWREEPHAFATTVRD